jgi:nicotinamidase-related amidase
MLARAPDLDNGEAAGFQVIVVDDACAAWEGGCHAASLRSLWRYFARIASTGEVVAGLEQVAEESGSR